MDGNTEDLQKFVPQVHFEQIPIKNLCSNQDYQRNLSINTFSVLLLILTFIR